MIYGKRNYVTISNPKAAVGIKNNKIIGGPINAVIKHAEKIVKLERGGSKPSDIAKLIQKKIGGEIDEIIKFLPPINLKAF